MRKFIFTLLFALSLINTGISQNILTKLPDIYSYPGEITIPVEVINFNGVASISLVLNYDNTILEFTGIQNPNPNLNGSFITNAIQGSNGYMLVLSWFALVPANIGSGNLLDLRFNYLGGATTVNWDTLNYGNCQYANLMGDVLPASFSDGSINPVNPNMTSVPQIKAIPSTDIYVPVTVASFNNIAEIHLTLSHDHSVMTYEGIESQNPLLGNSVFSVTNGGNLVHIDWLSATAVNLGDDTLAVLRFQYLGGTSLLQWDTLTPGACYYKDGSGNILPGTFISGIVNPAQVQLGISSASICNGGDVSLPVSVGGAENVKSFRIKLNYNASVVSYISYNGLNSLLNNGMFNIQNFNGAVIVDWSSDTPVNIGNSVLFELNFHTIVNNGGLSDMTWESTSCEFRNQDSIAFPLNLVGGSLMVTPFINLGQDKEICIYHSTELYAGAFFASYLWSTGDTTSSILVDSLSGSGVYSVTVTDVNGCSGFDEIIVNFMPCVGIEEADEATNQLQVYPNPTSGGNVTVKLNSINGPVELYLYDMTGRLLNQRSINNSVYNTELSADIELPDAKGLYLLKVLSQGQVYSERIIVE
ncbi:MAG: cohesin domain-containing protein [Bacteroidales bacterium]